MGQTRGNPWNRDQKIGAWVLVVTTVGIVLTFVSPEARRFFGLDQPQPPKQEYATKTQPASKPVTSAVDPNPRKTKKVPPNANDAGASQTRIEIQPPSSPDDLSGIWSATYPGGPLDVSIQQTGKRVVATLLKGNSYIPAGEITFHGTYDSNPFRAQQVCALPNFVNAHWVDVQIQVIDGDHMTEEESTRNCSSSPVLWHRHKNSTPR